MYSPPKPIPAYQAGYVVNGFNEKGNPVRPQFPYITYEIVLPAFLRFSVVTATIWDKSVETPGFHGIIDDVLRQAQKRIPNDGIFLMLDNETGMIWLQRNNNNFITINVQKIKHEK